MGYVAITGILSITLITLVGIACMMYVTLKR